jgi:hypothetical protein
MAKEQIIMERGSERSFIPKELAQEYLEAGWKEVERIVIGAEVNQPEEILPTDAVKPRATRKTAE